MSRARNPSRSLQWTDPQGYWNLRLLIAAISAIVLHVFCFYVFQVQDPKASRVLPATTQVTYLSAANPEAEWVLRQIDDYYSAFDSTLNLDSDLHQSLTMGDGRYPSSRWYVDLMPAPYLDSATNREPFLGVLPSLPASDDGSKHMGHLTYSESIRHRVLTVNLEFDLASALPEGRPSASWRIAIAPSGKVAYLFPVGRHKDEKVASRIGLAIRQLTFQSAPSLKTLEWGTVTYEPSPPSKP